MQEAYRFPDVTLWPVGYHACVASSLELYWPTSYLVNRSLVPLRTRMKFFLQRVSGQFFEINLNRVLILVVSVDTYCTYWYFLCLLVLVVSIDTY